MVTVTFEDILEALPTLDSQQKIVLMRRLEGIVNIGEPHPLETNPAREVARLKFEQAGLLSHAFDNLEDDLILTDEEVYQAGILPIGAPPTENLVNEDRAEH